MNADRFYFQVDYQKIELARGGDIPLVLNASDEANICFNCKKKTCNGNCKYYHEEHKKLKSVKNK